MFACIVACFAIFWYAGRLLSLPTYRGFDGSLLRQPGVAGPVVAVAVAAVLLFALMIVVEVIASRFWLFAGPLAAAAGLSAWSFRGGPGYYSFLAADPVTAGTGPFFVLAAECLLLGLIFAGLWFVLYRWFYPPQGPGERPFTLIPTADAVQVVLTQAAFTALGVVLLVPSPDKKQAVIGVLFASMIATGITRYFHEDRAPAHWCWAGPFLVGIVGYLINAFGADAHLAVETGRLTGTFAALARPLPIDYASAGVVGSLIGLGMTTDDWQMVRRLAVRLPR
jgi:hypothetical protein